jgi:ABC-type phosphate transport system substrate-binding protein
MLYNNKTFPLTLALLLSFGVYLEPTRANENTQLIVAQAQEKATTFPLPDNLPENSVVKISSSQNVEQINNNLKQKFEAEYPNATVEVNATDSDAALKAVTEKKADLAAISRPLTETEEAQGFKTVPISREKIAIIVGENNPFDSSLTIQQFAQIFRGEITNWSDIGGDSQPIKLVDRDSINDTRRSFPVYPVFQSAEFKTGDNATVPSSNDLEAVVKELGTDGISYAPVSAVKDLKGIKVLSMHQTLPNDSRYPFSQPSLYVYQGEPNDAVKGFLGFATASIGQGIIQETLATGKSLPGVTTTASGTATDTTATTPNTANSAVSSTATDTTATTLNTANSAVSSTATDTTATTLNTANSAVSSTATDTTATTPDTSDTTTDNAPVKTAEQKSLNWLWFLLPIALLIGLLALLLRKRQDSTTTGIDNDGDDRELVGAGVGRTPLNPDGDNDGIVAGTALATGLGAAAIANRRQESSNFPTQVDTDAPVEGIRNKFDDISISNINEPEVSYVEGRIDDVRNRFDTNVTNIGDTVESIDNRLDNVTNINANTPKVSYVEGTIEDVDNRFNDVTTTNINSPDPYINAIDVEHRFEDAPTNINTPNIANLEATAEASPNQLEDVTINNINAPESYIEVQDVYQTFDDVPTNISTYEVTEFDNIQGIAPTGDRLNPEPPNVRSENFFEKIRDKAEEIADDVSNKASEIKDNLTNDSDRQV